MFKNILIATDGSELAGKAVRTGATLAKDLGAALTIVTVTEPWGMATGGEAVIAFPADDYAQAMSAHAKDILDKAAVIATSCGCSPGKTLHVNDQFPADAIVSSAKAENCDLIVMASHGRRGLSRMLLGSQAQHVMVYSSVPVLIHR